MTREKVHTYGEEHSLTQKIYDWTSNQHSIFEFLLHVKRELYELYGVGTNKIHPREMLLVFEELDIFPPDDPDPTVSRFQRYLVKAKPALREYYSLHKRDVHRGTAARVLLHIAHPGGEPHSRTRTWVPQPPPPRPFLVPPPPPPVPFPSIPNPWGPIGLRRAYADDDQSERWSLWPTTR